MQISRSSIMAKTQALLLIGIFASAGFDGCFSVVPGKCCFMVRNYPSLDPHHRLSLCFPGKSVGIVSTARVQHASPAASYSHTPERGWYSDKELTSEAVAGGCQDIAVQLITLCQEFPSSEVGLEGHPLHKTYAGITGGSFCCGDPFLSVS